MQEPGRNHYRAPLRPEAFLERFVDCCHSSPDLFLFFKLRLRAWEGDSGSMGHLWLPIQNMYFSYNMEKILSHNLENFLQMSFYIFLFLN